MQQGDIRIMACIKATSALRHANKGTFASRHTYKGTFASQHTYKRGIYIMTYPLEGICITRHWHLHLCKKTFASRLNMCVGTIMDKLYICTPTSDICIKKIASLKKRHVHHTDISHLHPRKKSICIVNKKI